MRMQPLLSHVIKTTRSLLVNVHFVSRGLTLLVFTDDGKCLLRDHKMVFCKRQNQNKKLHTCKCKHTRTIVLKDLIKKSPVLSGTPYPARNRFKSMRAWVSRPYTSDKVNGWVVRSTKRKSVVFVAESDFSPVNSMDMTMAFPKLPERRRMFYRSHLHRRRNGASDLTDLVHLIKGNYGMFLTLYPFYMLFNRVRIEWSSES